MLVMREDQPGRLMIQRSAARSMVVGVVVLGIAASAFAGGVSALDAYLPYAVVMFALGAVLAFIGLALVLGRVGFDIDQQRSALTEWRSYLSFRRTREYPLADIEAVVITKYWFFNRLGRTKQDFYYRLSLRTAEHDVLLSDKLTETHATNAAETISRFASLSVVQEKGRAEGVVAGR